jgi:pentatricopeptide repeat protein
MVLADRGQEGGDGSGAWKGTAVAVGLACLEVGKVALAERALEQAWPLDSETLKKFLQVCFDTGHVSEALFALKRAIPAPRRTPPEGVTATITSTAFDLECIHLVLRMLFHAGRAKEMAELVQDLRKAGVPLDESVFVEMIRAGFLMGDASTAVRTLAMMRLDGLAMTREVYEEMAKGFLIAGRPEQALSVLDEALVSGALHTASGTAAAAAAEAGSASALSIYDNSLSETAMSLLAHVILQQPSLSRSVVAKIGSHASTDSVLKSTIHAGILRRLCVLSGGTDPATVFFNVLRTTESPPCEIEYHAIAGEFGRLGHWDTAIALVGDANRVGIRDVRLQNVAIRAAVRQGALSKAVSLFEEMAELGVAPNVATFTILLEGAHKAGDGVLAERIFRELTFSGADRSFTEFWMRRMAGLLPAPPLAPAELPEIITSRRSSSSSKRSSARGSANQPEDPQPGSMSSSAAEEIHHYVLSIMLADPAAAIRVITEMAKRKSPPGVTLPRKTVHAVVKNLCEAGQVDAVIQLLGELSACGVVLGGAAMSRVLEALAHQGRALEALSVIRTRRHLFDAVTEEHFAIVLDALSRSKDAGLRYGEVSHLWRDMLAAPGVIPSKRAYLALLRSMISDPSSTPQQVQRVVEDMARAKIPLRSNDQLTLSKEPPNANPELVKIITTMTGNE